MTIVNQKSALLPVKLVDCGLWKSDPISSLFCKDLKEIESSEFDKIISKIKDKEDKDYFMSWYYKQPDGDLFVLNVSEKNLTDAGLGRLSEIKLKAQKEILIGIPNIKMVANHFCERRNQYGRVGDEKDDYYKAEYLVSLVEYFKQKGTRVIPLDNGKEEKEIIDLIYNIFDYAYFMKIEHPERPDVDCFTEAELIYIEEKGVDYFAYLEYKNREAEGFLSGDSNSDHLTGKLNYLVWRANKKMKKDLEKIAERVAQKHSPNVLQSESAKEELYKEITCALEKIKYIGDNIDNKGYHSQISNVCRFFERAIKTYKEKDFLSFKYYTEQAINGLWEIIKSPEEVVYE